MMDFDPIDIIEVGNKICICSCVLILLQNAFYRPKFFSYFLNLQIKSASSFVAAGGILLYIQRLAEAPVLGASGHVGNLNVADAMCRDVVGTMCSKHPSNSSLPSAWFENVTQVFYTNNTRCVVYFLCVFMFANCDMFARSLLSGLFCWFMKRRGMTDLIPIATSVMLPGDNEKERRLAIVELMLRKLQYIQTNIVYFMSVKISYLSAALFGLIVNPVRVILSDNLAVRFNGSDWRMVCGRQITFEDVYAMVRCRSFSNGERIESYCIVPNNSSLFHLETATWYFFLFLSVSCAVSLLNMMYGMWKLGMRRMTDINLIKFLKLNVDYRRHKAVIDLFEMKLEERTRKIVEGEKGKNTKQGENEMALPLAKNFDQDVGSNSEDTLVVRMDVGISNPD